MFDSLNNDRVTFTEYLKMTKDVFVNNFGNIMFLGVIVFIPYILLNLFLTGMIYDAFLPFYEYITTADYLEIDKLEQYMEGMLGIICILFLIATFFTSIVKGGVVYITNNAVKEEKIEKSEIISNSIGKIGRLFFSRLFYIMIVGFTMPTIIFPFYFGINMIFYAEENIIGGKKTFDALGGSTRLIKNQRGRFWDVLNFYAGFYLMNIGVTFLLNWILPSFSVYGIIGLIFGNLISSTLLLFFTIPVTLKYINLKRFDLKQNEYDEDLDVESVVVDSAFLEKIEEEKEEILSQEDKIEE